MTDLVEMSLVKMEKLDKDLLLAWSTVEHWLENWQDPHYAYIYSDQCAYCKEYMDKGPNIGKIMEKTTCDGCPVKERSGHDGCQNTPWVHCETGAFFDEDDEDQVDGLVASIEEEYVYLVEIALDLTHRYQVREGLL